jgi:succinate dehydrogenase/fumarate reductase flavoprotein subunit
MEHDFDVVVVGSGAAGLSAALTCRAAGLSVAVLEKTDLYGGSTAVSGGAVWIPDNPHMAGVGHKDSRERALRYLRATVGDRLPEAMVDAFLTEGPKMVSFLEANSECRFIARAISPDYQPELDGGSQGGRTIDPAPFDGRRLGPLFKHLRPPIHSFLALGGMMVGRKDIDALLGMRRSWKAMKYSIGLVARYALDRLRWPRGTRLLMGNALAAALLQSARQAAVELRRQVNVLRLLQDMDGRVNGVEADTPDGKVIFHTRYGVVLASGGFAQNAAMRAEHLPHADVHRSMAPAGSTGDGAKLAGALGGGLAEGNHGAAFWAPVSIMRERNGVETVYPHLVMDRQKPGIMAVNTAGRRFANEASSYHDFVAAMQRAHESSPCIPAWLICDAHFLRRYGLGLVRPQAMRLHRFLDSGYLLRAESITALAHLTGLPAGALEQSVARMNEAAQSGIDEEFGRGNSAYDRYLGDASHRPNPCLGPIRHAPFYAVKIWPGDIGMATGLRVVPQTRVLDALDQPIAGVYACGNDMNSIMAGTYPSAGITLGPALTFGYIAGKSIIAEAQGLKKPATAKSSSSTVTHAHV